MKNILFFVLLVCMALVLFDCKEADNNMTSEPVIIPEEYQGKWYLQNVPNIVEFEDAGELVCEIFADKITFYYFDHRYGEEVVNHFVGKSFKIAFITETGLSFDFPAIKNGQKYLYTGLMDVFGPSLGYYLNIFVFNVNDRTMDYRMFLKKET